MSHLRLENSKLSPTALIVLPAGVPLPPGLGVGMTLASFREVTREPEFVRGSITWPEALFSGQQLDALANALGLQALPDNSNTDRNRRTQIKEYLGIVD